MICVLSHSSKALMSALATLSPVSFDIPDQFKDPQDEIDGQKRGENAYLKHLTYEGAKERYEEITPEIEERLEFELKTIANTGYPGYFLIVQDFCAESRRMGVSVGPGRTGDIPRRLAGLIVGVPDQRAAGATEVVFKPLPYIRPQAR